MGLTYVGADLASPGREALTKRGFESHDIDLLDTESLYERLTEILGGRPLASMSVIDTLEHITTGPEVLSVLAEFARGLSGAPLVVSVPNVSHRDVALKLLVGRWDYTETGLLDRTHVVHHTESLLDSWMTAAGWREVGALDVRFANSDQYFPTDLVALNPSTLVGQALHTISERANANATVNQFVRAYLPGAARGQAWPSWARTPAPFLSVIMRTQGKRLETMRDALLCLLGQSDQDFELIVLPHKVTYEVQVKVERLVSDLPEALRERCRVLPVDHGGRTRPLNVGVQAAHGDYVAILDDDDLVLGHWVETFRRLAEAKPGRVLRCVAVEQDVAETTWAGDLVAHRTVSAVRKRFPSRFDLFAHLTENFSPPVSLAFPVSVFRDLGLSFDEDLNVLEDWDLLLRSALVCGVADDPQVTSVYRRWAVGEASHTLHSREEWKATEDAIIHRLDRHVHLLPPGSVSAIRRRSQSTALIGEPASPQLIDKYERDVAELRQALLTIERELHEVRVSRSWRITRPMRAVTGALRRNGRS
ncbi:methyltransferase domain-containing protein [Oryzihumus leptocrescens]